MNIIHMKDQIHVQKLNYTYTQVKLSGFKADDLPFKRGVNIWKELEGVVERVEITFYIRI